MQWEEEDEKLDIVYGTTAEFKNAIDGLATELNRYKDILSQQLPPDTSGSGCGNLIMGMKYGLFAVPLCGLGELLHGLAARFMTLAVNWLTASIGIGIEVKFKPPASSSQ